MSDRSAACLKLPETQDAQFMYRTAKPLLRACGVKSATGGNRPIEFTMEGDQFINERQLDIDQQADGIVVSGMFLNLRDGHSWLHL